MVEIIVVEKRLFVVAVVLLFRLRIPKRLMGWKRRQKPKIKIGCSEDRDIFYLWTLKVFSMYFDPKTLTMTVSITATMAVDASFETNDASEQLEFGSIV
jgi:hypothetical protein